MTNVVLVQADRRLFVLMQIYVWLKREYYLKTIFLVWNVDQC